MYASDGSEASLSENKSLSKVTCLRSRAMFHRKVSQANHVRRMMIARLTDDRESPSFILPSNHPNPSKKTKDLKVKDFSLTKLKFGRHHSQSSEGFEGNIRQKDVLSGRKCSSSVPPNALTNKWHSKNIYFQQNKVPDQRKCSETIQYSEEGCDADTNSDDYMLPSLSKLITRKPKKKNSIMSDNSLTLTKRIHCEKIKKEAPTDAKLILKPTVSTQCPKFNASTRIITPNQSSIEHRGKACSDKRVSKTVLDFFSKEEIREREYSNSLLKGELESSNNKGTDAQVAKHQLLPRKKDLNSIKPSKEENFIIDSKIPKKEAEKVQFSSNVTRFETVPKKQTKSKRKYKLRKMRNNKKLRDIVIKDIFSNSSQPTISPDSLDDQMKALNLKDIETTSVQEKVQCIFDEMAPGKSMESLATTSTLKSSRHQITKLKKGRLPTRINWRQLIKGKSKELLETMSTLKTKPHHVTELEKRRLPSRIPLAISRIKRTKIIPKERPSLDSLDDLFQTLGSRYVDLSILKVQSPPSIPMNQVDLEASKDPCPNAFSTKENSHQITLKKSPGPPSRLVVRKDKKISSEKTFNVLLENSYTASSDIENLQYDTTTDIEDKPEELCFAKDTCNANATVTVSSWLRNLQKKSELISGDKNKNEKIGGSFDVNKVGDDFDFRETPNSIGNGCKKQRSKSSRNCQPIKKITGKPNFDTDSSTSLSLSSCKYRPKPQMKNRKSVINMEKLMGKFSESFREVEFIESPIQKFMNEINSSLKGSEFDE